MVITGVPEEVSEDLHREELRELLADVELLLELPPVTTDVERLVLIVVAGRREDVLAQPDERGVVLVLGVAVDDRRNDDEVTNAGRVNRSVQTARVRDRDVDRCIDDREDEVERRDREGALLLAFPLEGVRGTEERDVLRVARRVRGRDVAVVGEHERGLAR